MALSFEDRLIGLSEDPRLGRFSAAIDRDSRLTFYRDGVLAADGRTAKALRHPYAVYAEVVAAGRVALGDTRTGLDRGSSPRI